MKCYTFDGSELKPLIELNERTVSGGNILRGIFFSDNREVRVNFKDSPRIVAGAVREASIRNIFPHGRENGLSFPTLVTGQNGGFLLRLLCPRDSSLTDVKIFGRGKFLHCASERATNDSLMILSPDSDCVVLEGKDRKVLIEIKNGKLSLKLNSEQKENKIYWLSRHNLTGEQMRKLKEIHGPDATILMTDVHLDDENDFLSHIEKRSDGFVYGIAPPNHIMRAIALGAKFGFFDMRPVGDGRLKVDKVYHSLNGQVVAVS